MQGYAIVRIDADAVAAQEDILLHFNEYMQRSEHSQSFVHSTEGYFQLRYGASVGALSAGPVAFGAFLESSGYKVSGISSAVALDGTEGTAFTFAKGGRAASAMISTVRVY